MIVLGNHIVLYPAKGAVIVESLATIQVYTEDDLLGGGI